MTVTEFYRKHRPRSLKQVRGQHDAVAVLVKHIANRTVPHALLFVGPSGVGKTTLARILAKHLKCGDLDFEEVNAADFKGIDTVREIRRKMNLAPMNGRCRIWLVDECHKLTSDAQTALLKLTEDPPDHVYFMFATTDPNKIIQTLRGRCTHITLNPLGTDHVREVLQDVIDKEGLEVSDTVLDKIIETAGGSGRKALVLLNQVAPLESEEERLGAISDVDTEVVAISIARALFDQRAKWPTISKLIKTLKEEDWEGIRYLILSYASTICLSGGPQSGRAARIIDLFRDNWYDCKKAGLVVSCYAAMH